MKKTSNIFKKVLQSSLLLAPSDCYCIIVSFMFHVLGPNDHSQHSMQISHRRQGLPPLHLDAVAECTQSARRGKYARQGASCHIPT